MKKYISREFGKVLAGVLSCCMLLTGCGTASQDEISWNLEEEAVMVTGAFDGEIVEVCVIDGDVVEYGMPLFKIK